MSDSASSSNGEGIPDDAGVQVGWSEADADEVGDARLENSDAAANGWSWIGCECDRVEHR